MRLKFSLLHMVNFAETLSLGNSQMWSIEYEMAQVRVSPHMLRFLSFVCAWNLPYGFRFFEELNFRDDANVVRHGMCCKVDDEGHLKLHISVNMWHFFFLCNHMACVCDFSLSRRYLPWSRAHFLLSIPVRIQKISFDETKAREFRTLKSFRRCSFIALKHFCSNSRPYKERILLRMHRWKFFSSDAHTQNRKYLSREEKGRSFGFVFIFLTIAHSRKRWWKKENIFVRTSKFV